MLVTNSKSKEVDGVVNEIYQQYLTTAVAKNYSAINSARELKKENNRKIKSRDKKKGYLIVLHN